VARLGGDEILRALRERGVRGYRAVRFRRNRSTILSVGRDGATLNLHDAFREAPARILDALATYLSSGRAGPDEVAAALRTIREWKVLRRGLREAGRRERRRRRGAGGSRGTPAHRTPCCATPEQRRYLRALYRHYNRTRFGGRLPANLTVRLSSRMRSRFGQVRLHRRADGRRIVLDIALHADLMLPGNDWARHDTLLHEMAHVEAWLRHGDAGHGEVWERIARRVRCEARACARRHIRTRGRGRAPSPHVPDDLERAA